MLGPKQQRVFDPEKELSPARDVSVQSAISSSMTCALNCETPWNGKLWPIPEPTSIRAEDNALTGIAIASAFGLIFGLFFGLLIHANLSKSPYFKVFKVL